MNSVYDKSNITPSGKKHSVVPKKMGFNNKPNSKMGHTNSMPISKIGHSSSFNTLPRTY